MKEQNKRANEFKYKKILSRCRGVDKAVFVDKCDIQLLCVFFYYNT